MNIDDKLSQVFDVAPINNQQVIAGVCGFLDFQQANTMVALNAEL